jgi:pimeloyl-ACP methyl ester carboxylesterase
VIVCPHESIGGSFYRPKPEQADLPEILARIRKQIHVDGDRIFLFGYGEGGNAAWTAAILHADLFTGAVILSGIPRIPYPQQVYPVLLPNLRHLPVAAGWYKPDVAAPSAQMDEVAAHNRVMVEFARQAGLPVTGVEMEGVSPPRPTPTFSSETARILSLRREGPPRTVGHWFRYPSQGQAGWLTQTEFRDDVWNAEQLAILPAAQTDADAYITEIVKDRLAFLGGRVDRQTLEIETHRCAEVAVSFEPGLVDLSKPVIVRCNGTVRHDGPITPSIEALLETAYEQWEFQRLMAAKLALTVRSEAETED